MTGCDHYQELISRLIDGELDGGESAELSAHLEGCPQCAGIYSMLSSVSELISEDMVEPPEQLSVNVMAQLRRESIKKRNRSRTRGVKYFLAAAACVALAVTGLYRSSAKGDSAAVYSLANTATEAADEESQSMQKSAAADAGATESESEAMLDTATEPNALLLCPAPEAVMRSAANGGLQRYDWGGLSALLDGKAAQTPVGAADAEYAVPVLLDGAEYEVSVLIYGDELWYCPPATENGELLLAACTVEEFEDYLQKLQ